MSWLFGIAGNYAGSIDKDLIKENLLFSFQSENLKLFVGGLKENVFYEKTSDTEGWAMCGIGIKKAGNKYRFMAFDDWKESTLKDGEDYGKLDGHFIFLKWNNNEITFFNDRLGLRDLYLLKNKHFTAFSTRLDYFTFLNHKSEINIEELSTYWLLSFPASTNSLLREVIRLGPGGKGKITKGEIIKNNNPLIFDFGNNDDVKEFVDELGNFTAFSLSQGEKISLGLSGGLDSRVLLEMLLKSGLKNWQTHFIGSPDNPDVKIAKQISVEKNIPYLNLFNPVPKPSETIKLLKNFIGQLGPVAPASEILVYPYYKILFDQGFRIIDGGDGEIHRREFLNRILFIAKGAVVTKDQEKLYKILSSNKAAIFNHEALTLMRNKAMNKISDLFGQMPECKGIGIENWLDLLILRYKLPNLSGPSQSLLDSVSIAYMPYIQPHLLEFSFHLAVMKKKNGKVFRNILDTGNHQLGSYKLVKNLIYYPYHSNSLTMRLVLALKRKIGKYYKEKTDEELLDIMKEYILDTVNSAEFDSFVYYNQANIKQMVNDYYKGNKSLAAQLNWWLTFDIWRSIFIN
jgi:hypothetical protein